MRPFIKTTIIVPLLAIVTGCAAIGEDAELARQKRLAEYEQTTKKLYESLWASSRNLCEIRNSDTPEAYKQSLIDSCTKYVYFAGVDNVTKQARERSIQNSLYPDNTRTYSAPSIGPKKYEKVYRADECIGPVINGRCHGSILQKGYAPTCYGTMLNGQCTGPMF